MWISKRFRDAMLQPRAERGNVILSSKNGVEAGGTITTRNVQSYLPYGYQSVPPVGEEVMLLPDMDGQVVIGAKTDCSVEPGEVVICSLGGARITLKNDGSIVLNSLVIDKDGVIKQ